MIESIGIEVVCHVDILLISMLVVKPTKLAKLLHPNFLLHLPWQEQKRPAKLGRNSKRPLTALHMHIEETDNIHYIESDDVRTDDVLRPT